MHLPELALLLCGHGRGGCQGGLRMDVQWKLLEEQPDLRGISPQHGLYLRRGHGAVGTLEIGELDQCDGSVIGSGLGCAGGGNLDGIFQQLVLGRMREAGGFRVRQGILLALAGFNGRHDDRCQSLAIKAIRILHAALGHFHAAAASAIAATQQFQDGSLLRRRETAEVDGRERFESIPVLSANQRGSQNI